MASVYNGKLKLSVFGQSHSAGIGMTLDGLPTGEKIDFELLQRFMDRRAGGKAWSTPRKEADIPEFLSGFVNDITCGAPAAAVLKNSNTRSSDYDNLRDVPRPGHADYTAQIRYGGFQDVSGGGHFSGRLTAPLCAAGGICMQILERRGIYIGAHLLSVAGERDRSYDPVNVTPDDLKAAGAKAFPVLDDTAGERMSDCIRRAKEELDSVGGIIECAVTGVPAGLGDPMFDGMENRLSRALFAIPAIKGIEFGDGFAVADARGSENNDAYIMDGDTVKTVTNHCGGILGGITNGMPLLMRVAVKPTPSISKRQNSVSLSKKENTVLEIHGRHDPCIAPRAVPCVEAVTAIVILDAMLEGGKL